MKEFDKDEARSKLAGLGRNSMRKSYYGELLNEKQKLEAQNVQLIEEIQNRIVAEERLQELNDQLEDRIQERTQALESMNHALEESLNELRQAQEYIIQTEKLTALGGLVAGISHEVNTPLGVCITSITYLQDQIKNFEKDYRSLEMSPGQFEENFKEIGDVSEIIFNNLYRSATILNNFKQIAIDQSQYEYRKFKFREYLEKILSNLSLELRKFGAKVIIDSDEELEIFGYPGILNQVITNLIMNSLIHGFSESGNHEIQIGYRADLVTLFLDYRDNGVGMDSKAAVRAFEPFFTTRRGRGGSGLGLYIVYNLITSRLKGTISLNTENGRGVHFSMQCPLNYKMNDDEEAGVY